MKTFLFSYKFLFLALTALPLAMCSSNDDNTEENDFEVTTLNLSGLSVQQDDTSFTVNGYSFKNTNAESAETGISIWNDGTDFHYIELELNDVTGLSKITSRVFNNGTQTKVTLYNNDIIVQEIEAPFNVSDIVMNVQEQEFDKLRLSSFEGEAISIKLE